MDSGEIEVFTGYRVQYNITLGPGQGRHPLPPGRHARRGDGARRVDDLEVRRRPDPVRRRQGRRRLRSHRGCRGASSSALTRRYVAEIIDAIGPEKDIPAPDVNTNDQVMAWVMDTYSMHVGAHDDGRRHRQAARARRIAGPPRGHRPRRDASSRARRRATSGFDLNGARVAVQGFGNVGSVSAQLLARASARGSSRVTDWKGGVYNDRGPRRGRADRVRAPAPDRRRLPRRPSR